MSLVPHTDCRTAKDVLLLARRVRGPVMVPVVCPAKPERISFRTLTTFPTREQRKLARASCLRAISRMWRDPSIRRVTVEDIIHATCKHFGISRVEFMSQRRSCVVVRPRQIAMYLAKELTMNSLPSIGKMFAGRDHTTILHGVRKIARLLPDDASLQAEVESIKQNVWNA